MTCQFIELPIEELFYLNNQAVIPDSLYNEVLYLRTTASLFVEEYFEKKYGVNY